jgi:hypothetical protein
MGRESGGVSQVKCYEEGNLGENFTSGWGRLGFQRGKRLGSYDVRCATKKIDSVIVDVEFPFVSKRRFPKRILGKRTGGLNGNFTIG